MDSPFGQEHVGENASWALMEVDELLIIDAELSRMNFFKRGVSTERLK